MEVLVSEERGGNEREIRKRDRSGVRDRRGSRGIEYIGR